jgi:hypothetical protein
MNEAFQALKKIAPKLNQLQEHLDARVSYELMSGGLVWSDELPPWEQLEPGESHCLRAIWRFRSSLILGCPVEKFRPHWEEAQRLFPKWPGFNPVRQDEQWRTYLVEAEEKSLRDWEELDRKYRDQHPVEGKTEKQPVI